MQWALNLAAAPSLTLLMILAAVFGGVAANGIWVLAGFTLTAWAMFLLARRLTGRADAALVAGLAFGFWPYAYATVSQPLGHGWVLVVLVWRMIELLERPSARNGLWAGAAAVLAMWWVQYWLLIAGTLWATLALFALVVAARRGTLLRAVGAHAASAALVVALLLVLAAAGLASGFEDVPERDPGDQALYSARAAMYLVPSPSQPVVGRWTSPYLTDRYGHDSAGAAYNPIYLGIATLLLAGLGVLTLIRSWRSRVDRTPPHVTASAACALGGAVALIMSAPPRLDVFGLAVPMPTALLSELTTAFRTSARFAHVVMLAVCILAAVGVAVILRGRRPVVAALLLPLIAIVVFVDLWGRSDVGSPVRIEVPPTVRLLRDLPRGITATYPLNPSTVDRSGPLFTSVFHGQPIFTAYRQGTPSETRKLGLARLALPWVPGALAAYGVRYVLVETAAALPDGETPGLRRIGRDFYATLYEVTAPPTRDLVMARHGFSFVEGDGPAAFRYMTARTGELELRASCDGCRRILRLSAAAVGEPRRLVVRDVRGAVLLRTSVSLESTSIRVPVTVSGRTVVTLTVDPPPMPIPGDFRQAGIFVNVRLRLEPPRSTRADPALEGRAR